MRSRAQSRLKAPRSGTADPDWVLTTRIAQQLGAPNTKGALVYRVDPRSDAYRAGLQRGDIIVGYNGTPLDDTYQFLRLLSDTKTGTMVTLDVLREGRKAAVKVTVEQAGGRPRA